MHGWSNFIAHVQDIFGFTEEDRKLEASGFAPEGGLEDEDEEIL